MLLEIYEWPWWRTLVPYQRPRGPSYRLTPSQVGKLIRDVEHWIARTWNWEADYILEEQDSSDLIARISEGRCIAPFDGEMPQPDSGDSYNAFERRNPHLCGRYRGERSGLSPSAAAEQQIAWEAERYARRRAKEAEATRLWDEELAERVRQEWFRISDRFIGQAFIRVRIGPQNVQVRDEDSSWSRQFMTGKIYYVPDEVADALINLHSSQRLGDE